MKILEIINESWSNKYKKSINCSHPKGFSQKAHCAGKSKHNEGVAEGLFGIDDKIKGRIQNIVSDLSDIPGMWNHEAETFTDAGMDKLKTVLKNNPKYIKYALNLTYRDYEAEGVAEGSDDNDTAKAAYMYGLRHGREGVGNNMDRVQAEWGDNFKYYNAGFLKGRNEKAKSLKAVGQGYSNKQQGMAEDWNTVNKKDKTNGLSQKAVNAYRRENPGSKLKTAVTTKPSKLKPGSKSAKRRKSFCARMSGNKGPMKKPNGEATPKALALRRWNCESVEAMVNLIIENMDHSKDNQAVPELKAALMAKKAVLQKATDDQVYDIIDTIMTRIAKSHGISGQKLHDMWVDEYDQIPDTWIMK